MSKRAEKAVKRIHNRALLEAEKYATSHGRSIVEEVAFGRGFKAGFIKGYDQAEKDLALTWEDIQTIDNIVVDMARNTDWPLRGQEVFYTEVLNRFNKSKEERK